MHPASYAPEEFWGDTIAGVAGVNGTRSEPARWITRVLDLIPMKHRRTAALEYALDDSLGRVWMPAVRCLVDYGVPLPETVRGKPLLNHATNSRNIDLLQLVVRSGQPTAPELEQRAKALVRTKNGLWRGHAEIGLQMAGMLRAAGAMERLKTAATEPVQANLRLESDERSTDTTAPHNAIHAGSWRL